RQRVSDGAGGFAETWAPLGQLWADINTRGASDGRLDAGPSTKMRHRLVVRGADETSPMRPKIGQRLRTGSRVFVIYGVSERDVTGLYLEIWAEEEVLA
ncbi:MAG: head-tail adaptor protein, partial [Pseudomonadota bacterium]